MGLAAEVGGGSFSSPASDGDGDVDVCVSRGSSPALAIPAGLARLDTKMAAITKPYVAFNANEVKSE